MMYNISLGRLYTFFILLYEMCSYANYSVVTTIYSKK